MSGFSSSGARASEYNSTAPTLTDGENAIQQLDVNGNLKTNDQYAPQYELNHLGVAAVQWRAVNSSELTASLATGFGVVTKALVKNTAGNVFTVTISNANAAIRYLLIHNKSTIPVATDVPLVAIAIPATSSVSFGAEAFTLAGLRCSIGIGWAVSTTAATFTDSATAGEHILSLHYV